MSPVHCTQVMVAVLPVQKGLQSYKDLVIFANHPSYPTTKTYKLVYIRTYAHEHHYWSHDCHVTHLWKHAQSPLHLVPVNVAMVPGLVKETIL